MDLIDSSESGTFHQSSIEQFSVSAGRQCSCNALYSLIYSISKSSLNRWDSRDLDIMLFNRDLLFKAQDKPYLLSVPDLPQRFPIGKAECSVEYQDKCFGFIMSTKYSVGLANELSSSLSVNTGIVFFVTGLCLGIMSFKGYIYLFNSHNRDPHGRHTQDRTSVLLRFAWYFEIYHINLRYTSPD